MNEPVVVMANAYRKFGSVTVRRTVTMDLMKSAVNIAIKTI
jgi:hypothetical protein